VNQYKEVHRNVWPGVLNAIRRYHIVDYSINHYPQLNLLIANFKYTGNDFEKDMKAIGDDEETQRWWRLTDSMQESFNDGASGSGKEIPWWTVSLLYRQEIFAS
jgi:L-rhamnose mutarotase